jgi:HAD superfamily hydrolase (TIGR01509 family)
MPVRAILFDLNGTISHDEELYYELFAELFAREGKPVTREAYFSQLVGHVDDEVVRLWLGHDFPRVPELVAERIERFLERVRDGRTVPEAARRAVHAAAAAVPVAIVSSAFRVEVDAILSGSRLDAVATAVVAFEDAGRAKPDPAPYATALRALGVDAANAVALEDTAVGISAAKAAGLRCVAVLGSQAREHLAAADAIADTLDEGLVARLLSPPAERQGVRGTGRSGPFTAQ